METHGDTVALIQAAFPGHDGLIQRASSQNPTFRDLCEDYKYCAEALDRRERGEVAGEPDHRQEYAELLEQLRQEIETWLDALGDGFSVSRGDQG